MWLLLLQTVAMARTPNEDSVEGCSLAVRDGLVVLSNGYLQATFDTAAPGIPSIVADFQGQMKYGPNVLATGGIVTEREDGDGTTHISSKGASPTLKVQVLQNYSGIVEVLISGIVDDVQNPLVNESWRLGLAYSDRYLQLSIEGSTLRPDKIKAVRHAMYFKATSIYALYERGVVQMKNAPPSADFFGSLDKLERFYALGGGTSVDIERSGKAGDVTLLLSSNSGNPYWSGFQEVVAGNFSKIDKWDIGWQGLETYSVDSGTAWSSYYLIGPNNFDFPAIRIPRYVNFPDEHTKAIMTGIYASPVGCMNGYDKNYPGQIAPSIHRPDTAYGNTYNYFDPDNFFAISAMLHSGEPYLMEESRKIIERTGAFMLKNGQVPHHFEGKPTTPTYIALSGATQTGPNIFWTLTALRYARAAGNLDWLTGYMGKLRQSSSFLLGFLNSTVGLLDVPGSLMIDVFIRQRYASDTNVMMVGFLREMADAERAVNNETGAITYDSIADSIKKQINQKLWSGDHFVTQLNPDGTIRDFVDYDANLIAVANGVAEGDRARQILARVDKGQCTHSATGRGSATYVAERYYGPDECFKQNVGDSTCSMARIGYFDALARRAVGDITTYQDVILNPILQDLLSYTWLRERYGCDGKQQSNRTEEYFEYPAFVVMALREVTYGIDIGLREIVIAPFNSTKSFEWRFGIVDLYYSAPWQFQLAIAWSTTQSRIVKVANLKPSATYALTNTGASVCGKSSDKVTTTPQGLAVFRADFGPTCLCKLVQQ